MMNFNIGLSSVTSLMAVLSSQKPKLDFVMYRSRTSNSLDLQLASRPFQLGRLYYYKGTYEPNAFIALLITFIDICMKPDYFLSPSVPAAHL